MEQFTPTDLYYLITFKCNERCTKCNHWKMNYIEDIQSHLVSRLFDSITSLKKLLYCRWRTFNKKKMISYIYLKKADNKKIRTTIITNGILMNAKFIDMIKYFNVHIVVSVDTLNQDKWKFIRGTDSYEIVMNNLDYALKELNSNQISLQSVLAKETLDDVKQVGLFASERNVFS